MSDPDTPEPGVFQPLPDERLHTQVDHGMVSWRPSRIAIENMRGIDPGDVVRFLAELSVDGNVTRACKRSRISHTHVYKLRKDLPEMRQAWKHALRMAKDNLEAEMYRRAVKGVTKPVFQGGRQVGVITEYSDSLLLAMLRARDERYRASAGGVNVKVDQRDQSRNINIGPPEPSDGDLKTYIGRLSELADKHLPSDSQVVDMTPEDSSDGEAA